MRRWIAVSWHASFFATAAALYFFFVLPRWFELTGAWPVGLGLAMRIVCGALIGLAALPVVFTFLRTRRPEFGTPQLALSLRIWSIVLHVLAGALIVGAAISEIWVTLDSTGPTLFGIYGAAAAIAILGALSFYLAFAAELPPPPPKPLKARSQTRSRRPGPTTETETETVQAGEAGAETETADAEPETVEAEATEAEPVEPVEAEPVEPVEAEAAGDAPEGPETPEPEADEPGNDDVGNAEHPNADQSGGTLRNRRPVGKSTSGRFGRSRAT